MFFSAFKDNGNHYLSRATEYRFETENGAKTLLELASASEYPHLYRVLDDEEESAEYWVPVRWLYTVERLMQEWQLNNGEKSVEC